MIRCQNMKFDDHLILNVLSRIELAYQKADNAFGLRNELIQNMNFICNKMEKNILKNNIALVKKFITKNDMISLNSGSKHGVLIFSNMFGNDAISDFTLLSYLNMKIDRKYNIHAVLHVNQPNLKDNVNKHIQTLIKRIIVDEQVSRAIILADAMPHFDDFYISTPIQGKKNKILASKVISHMKKMGYPVGKYSLEEDGPSHEIYNTSNALLNYLGELGMLSLQLHLTTNIGASLRAMEYLFSQSKKKNT